MIFDGKVLSEINNEEIARLVKEHIVERQNIEYKVTIDHKSDDNRFETLCDLSSLANGGGGYMIIGIRDDGKGHAQKFESVKDSEKIIKSIQSLCLDYISERIDGLEIDTRNIDGNIVIIIRVPASSRIPHMVLYKNNTHFVTRYYDGKREMTIGEIRSAFSENFISRRLLVIEEGVKSIISSNTSKQKHEMLDAIIKGEISDLEISDGIILTKGRTKRFQNNVDEQAFYRISVTPVSIHRNLLNVDVKQVIDLIKYPPEQRPNGWNMEFAYASTNRFSEGIICGGQNGKALILLQNGHMEFYVPIDYSFSWNQSEQEYKKHPLLYPFPVVEYPLSFLRLYKKLVELTDIQTSFFVSMQYINIHGFILRPYAPQSIGFMIPRMEIKPYTEKHFLSPINKLENNFDPDEACFELLKVLYATFGFLPDMIPFYKGSLKKFNLE